MSSLKVFLCHASLDKPSVRGLYTKLYEDGFQPWLDEEDLLPGQDWDLEIRRAIRICDVVLVCLSQGSVTRVGYLQKEIRHVLDVADEQPEGTIFLIPARIETCSVPDRLRRWHWVDLFEDGGYEKLTRALNARANPTDSLSETLRRVNLRLDGLYVKTSQDSDSIIRFFPENRVMQVSVSNSTKYDLVAIMGWLTLDRADLRGEGAYELDGNSISFSNHSQYGVVLYWGTVHEGGLLLRLNVHSQINDNRSFGEWRFHPVH